MNRQGADAELSVTNSDATAFDGIDHWRPFVSEKGDRLPMTTDVPENAAQKPISRRNFLATAATASATAAATPVAPAADDPPASQQPATPPANPLSPLGEAQVQAIFK